MFKQDVPDSQGIVDCLRAPWTSSQLRTIARHQGNYSSCGKCWTRVATLSVTCGQNATWIPFNFQRGTSDESVQRYGCAETAQEADLVKSSHLTAIAAAVGRPASMTYPAPNTPKSINVDVRGAYCETSGLTTRQLLRKLAVPDLPSMYLEMAVTLVSDREPGQ